MWNFGDPVVAVARGAITPGSSGVARAEGLVRIGTCNVAKVFDSLDEKKAIEMGMKENAAKHQAEVARRRKAIEDLYWGVMSSNGFLFNH